MKRIILISLILFSFVLTGISQAGHKMSREDYIEEYKDLAIKEMYRSGIPASITLAQGMLESDNGNSRLAVKGNNHFGIKCHSDWDGKKIHHNDDKRNECFRKYNSVYDSYIDHSEFLMNGSRYSFLFELDRTDYKGWAKGLKKAGYATSKKYADLLIRIIEENNLHQYDLIDKEYIPLTESNIKRETEEGRAVMSNNRIDFVIVKEGDSFESLAEELKLLNFELYRYNELTSDSILNPGQILYLQPKRNKAERGKKVHILEEGESLWAVSQKYGIKLQRLLNMNNLSKDDILKPGTELYLRKFKPSVPKIELPIEEDQEGAEEQWEFQFDG